MPLSPADRAAINRANSQKSTGPRSHSGKCASRGNALKHGLRAEVLPMPGEDPAYVARRAAEWFDHYRPRSPAARHLVYECVRASVMSERVDAAHVAASEARFQALRDERDDAAQDEVDAELARLRDHPAAAAARLGSTPAGCRWLVAFWERLAEALPSPRGADPDDFETALDLLGRGTARGRDFDQAVGLLLSAYKPGSRGPEHAEALRRLEATVAAERAALTAALAQFTDPADSREVAADAALCLLPDGPTAALLLRYRAEARTSFLRALKALTETLKRDEFERRRVEDEEVEAPPEAELPAQAVTPNEPGPAQAVSPNEPKRPLVFTSYGPKGDPTVRDTLGRPTNMVNLCIGRVS